jgi:hypothetical protein
MDRRSLRVLRYTGCGSAIEQRWLKLLRSWCCPSFLGDRFGFEDLRTWEAFGSVVSRSLSYHSTMGMQHELIEWDAF